ncbi:MAG: 4Fe-4S binding protein [Peptococcaceae bacterium]|nr:4Fe-4S binding protein [Peptococcaceae bacterium]
MAKTIPLLIGLSVAAILYLSVGWWGFLMLFPWIGFSISLGLYIQSVLPGQKKATGRKIAILMILPSLLIFVPVANNENFQLEGIVLLILIGYFSKGFIHYAVAKIFGPLIWGRGFCGWACWTAAVLDWLPIKNAGRVPPGLKKIRYITFAISIIFPVSLVFFLGFDVRRDYLHKTEMLWMFAGNIIYYAVAVALAFAFKNKRAFCKIACPVAVVMKVPSSVSRIAISPSGKKCLGCSLCNKSCPMDVDVMSYISRGAKVRDTECVLCMDCKFACPAGAIK